MRRSRPKGQDGFFLSVSGNARSGFDRLRALFTGHVFSCKNLPQKGRFQSVDKLFCGSKTTKSFRPPFSKGGGVEGRRPHRSPQAAKFLFQKSAGGAKNSPVDCFSVGILACRLGRCFCLRQRYPPDTRTPRRGFPIVLRLLCILPSDTYFFYTLRRRLGFRRIFAVKSGFVRNS